jgi:hypothetical protein
VITQKTYEDLMRIASRGDGFQWNPYSWQDIHRAAGRAKKKGLLVRNKEVPCKWPLLIPKERKVAP